VWTALVTGVLWERWEGKNRISERGGGGGGEQQQWRDETIDGHVLCAPAHPKTSIYRTFLTLDPPQLMGTVFPSLLFFLIHIVAPF
jgi:hypothetical protein